MKDDTNPPERENVVQIRDTSGMETLYSYGCTFPCTHVVDRVKGISTRQMRREAARAQRRAAKKRRP